MITPILTTHVILILTTHYDVITLILTIVMSGSVDREHGGVYTCTAENGVSRELLTHCVVT